jgi:hypothetical protein
MKGVSHKTTIIFLHDYEDTNENIFKMFADPFNGKSLAPKTSRIVIPLAPERKITARGVTGPKRAWFNLLLAGYFEPLGKILLNDPGSIFD